MSEEEQLLGKVCPSDNGTDHTVSVIIPAFNEETYLRDAIRSVLSQTRGPTECIVVDDGSEDATASIAQSFSEVVYLHQPNAGVAAARNRGIAEARGSLIAFLDADDVWLPEKLERQVARLGDSQEIGLVYCGMSQTDESLNPIFERPAPAESCALRNTLLMEPPVVSLSQTGLMPRKVFDEVGGFDESLSTSADADMVLRITSRFAVARLGESLVLYRSHPRQMSLNPDSMEHDMKIVLSKFFSLSTVPADVRRLRRRAYANLWLSLGGARFVSGRRWAASRDLARGFAFHPPRALAVLSRRFVRVTHPESSKRQ